MTPEQALVAGLRDALRHALPGVADSVHAEALGISRQAWSRAVQSGAKLSTVATWLDHWNAEHEVGQLLSIGVELAGSRIAVRWYVGLANGTMLVPR